MTPPRGTAPETGPSAPLPAPPPPADTGRRPTPHRHAQAVSAPQPRTRTRTALLAVLLVLAGAGVGVIAVDGQSTATAITDPHAAQQWRRDADYLAEVHTHGVKATEGALLATARNLCRAADQGAALDELVVAVEDRYAVPDPDAQWLVRAAIQARCPQHQDLSVGLPPGKAMAGP